MTVVPWPESAVTSEPSRRLRLDGGAVRDARDPAPHDDELGLAAADRDFVVLDVHDFTDDPARREDLVAALQRLEECVVFLALAALRADKNEVEDCDEQTDLNDERTRSRPTRAGWGEQQQGQRSRDHATPVC